MIRQRSVKVNIGWCENDYQVDIATAAGREEYKRIVDRASQLGITHLLFAPRNSDVSSAANNTDPWGWEQILWFGMGQKRARLRGSNPPFRPIAGRRGGRGSESPSARTRLAPSRPSRRQ